MVNIDMNKKIKKIYNKLENYITTENYIILLITGLIAIPLFKNFSFFLTKDNTTLYLSVVVASIAYATFFINYQKSFIKDKKYKQNIKFLIDLFISSSILLLFVVLVANSDVNIGKLNYLIAYPLAFFAMLSLLTFSFCIVKLWWLLVKGMFKK